MYGTDWNDERVELLKKLWAEGLTSGQIALRIPGTTRNGIIGKIHRLGLAGRVIVKLKGDRRKERKPSAQRKPPAPKRPTTPLEALYAACQVPDAPPMVEELVIPLAERKQLVDLEERDCRWPIGDVQQEGFHFCGRGKVDGLPYCEHHARRAYQPPQAKQRKEKPRFVFTPLNSAAKRSIGWNPSAGGGDGSAGSETPATDQPRETEDVS